MMSYRYCRCIVLTVWLFSWVTVFILSGYNVSVQVLRYRFVVLKFQSLVVICALHFRLCWVDFFFFFFFFFCFFFFFFFFFFFLFRICVFVSVYLCVFGTIQIKGLFCRYGRLSILSSVQLVWLVQFWLFVTCAFRPIQSLRWLDLMLQWLNYFLIGRFDIDLTRTLWFLKKKIIILLIDWLIWYHQLIFILYGIAAGTLLCRAARGFWCQNIYDVLCRDGFWHLGQETLTQTNINNKFIQFKFTI